MKRDVLFNNRHGFIDFQVMFPKQIPIVGIKHFTDHNHTPFKETLITPSSPDSFDPVLELTEMVFDPIGGKRGPFPVLQPQFQEGGHGLRQIGYVGPGPRISFGIEPVDQFSK